ncbi:MAG TPA: hypothetical protein VMU17_02375, partial [Elusimicrobiota bacterium]|nr:hypothetical protein [Elusimicrobiota bacterium]
MRDAPVFRQPEIAILAALVLWMALGPLYILRTPRGAFNHDYRHHVYYTEFLAHERRLPAPGEGWESQQPPLYYLIVSRFSPLSPRHIFWTRLFSVELGLLALAVMAYALYRTG